MPRPTRALARLAAIVPLLFAVALVACGGETTDVTDGVDELNELFAPAGIVFNCPDEVDGGEGTTFDCTIEARDGGASETVTMVIETEDDELVINPTDQEQFEQAVDDVAAE